jgi:hypothetical protein
MPADAYWSLAMAINVYLALFRHFDTTSLKQLHWKYFVFCYGIPLIPGIVYLAIETPSRGKIYGGATVSFTLSAKR